MRLPTRYRVAAIVAWTVLLVGLLVLVARADSHTPGAQLGQAIETGRLPEWVSAGARVELRFHQMRVITCLEDRERTRRWVTWGHWDDYLAWTLTGRWTFGKAEPVPPEYWAMCGFPVPGPAGPVALGEPAYWSVVCVGACRDGQVDWASQNRPANVAGPTTKGEPCGAPLSGHLEGWHQIPRLASPGGPTPVTRCQ